MVRWLARPPVGRRQHARVAATGPRILAVVPEGPDRLVLQTVTAEAGWTLETGGHPSPIVVYDRSLSPSRWGEAVRAFTRVSPRPCVILLSRSIDEPLWEELQRAGGSDIVRTPIAPDRLREALAAAWQLWTAQRALRDDALADRVED